MTIRRQNERGFALLLVFAMAAAIAVMLYLEMPRVAFEHQRGKEALLVDRGEQYMRAIQMYHKKFNKLPQTLDDLDTGGNQRFLRRRYKDPMTGQDEWRLVHTDASGQYMDSLVHKRQDQKEKSGPSILSSNIVGIGESAQYVPQAGEKTSAAQQKRASDRIIPSGPGSGAPTVEGEQPVTDPNGPQPRAPQQPPGGAVPGGPPAPPQTSAGGNPFQTPTTQQPGGQPMNPGMTQGTNMRVGGMNGQPVNPNGVQGSGQASSNTGFGFSSGFGNSASTQTGQTGQTGNRSGTAGFGQSGSNQGSGGFGQGGFGQSQGGFGQSGQNQGGFGQGGQSQGGFGQGGFGQSSQSQGGFGQGSIGQSGFGGNSGTSNSALGAIQNSLRNTGQGGIQQAGNMMGTGLGAGIVGVASKKEAEGILVYKERTNYTEWEFLFDPKAVAQAGQAGAMGQGQPGQGQNRGNSSGFGGMGSSGNSGFGGFGSSSGSSGSGFGGFGSSSGSSSGSGFGGFGGSSGSSGSGFGFGGSGSSGSQPRPAPGGFGRQ